MDLVEKEIQINVIIMKSIIPIVYVFFFQNVKGIPKLTVCE